MCLVSFLLNQSLETSKIQKKMGKYLKLYKTLDQEDRQNWSADQGKRKK